MLKDQPALRQDIMEGLGLKDLPPETQDRLFKKLLSLLEEKIGQRILEELPEAEHKTFLEYTKTGKEEEMKQYIESKIPNFDEMVTEEVAGFKEEMLQSLTDLQGQFDKEKK